MGRSCCHRSSGLLACFIVLLLPAACGGGGGSARVEGGVRVLVSEPADAGMDALHSGPLEVVAGCLGVGGVVVVWPHGTTVTDREPLRVELPDGGVFGLGEQVEVAGGFVLEHSSDDARAGPYDVAGVTVPEECARHDVFLAH